MRHPSASTLAKLMAFIFRSLDGVIASRDGDLYLPGQRIGES